MAEVEFSKELLSSKSDLLHRHELAESLTRFYWYGFRFSSFKFTDWPTSVLNRWKQILGFPSKIIVELPNYSLGMNLQRS